MTLKPSLKTALLSAAALGTAFTIANGPVAAAGEKEKCYGVTVAGSNDCATGTSSCAGTSKVDRQTDAFIAVPKGLCKKIVGGNLESKKS